MGKRIVEGNLACQGPMHRTADGDLAQAGDLFLIERPGHGYSGADAVEQSGCGFAVGTVFGVDAVVVKLDNHVL